MPTNNQGTRGRTGGMGVLLVVVGIFLTSGQNQKLKKSKSIGYTTTTITRATEVSVEPLQGQTTNAEKEDILSGDNGHALQNSGTLNSNFTSPPPPTVLQRKNLANMHAMSDTRK
ncbi:hypothetical protein RYX36_016049 [Vicia faba]